MGKNRYGLYSFAVFMLIASSITTPVFGEVTNLTTNQESFLKWDKITFSGSVEQGDTGLVTIVIRDNNEKFVMLSQAIINSDNTFEKIIEIDNRFTNHGFHNATGFILNMSKGITSSFGVSQTGIHLIPQETIEDKEEDTISESVVENTLADFVDLNKEPVYYVERYYTEPAYKSWFERNYPGMTIEEAVGYEGINDIVESTETEPVEINEILIEDPVSESVVENTLADFVDLNKEPVYYVERYYTEPAYKSWFERNYPGMTIEEAVGYEGEIAQFTSKVKDIIDSEIIPEAEAISTTTPVGENDNPEIAQIALAIAGLGILFGAVYGIKQKVDDNSRQISINRDTIRKKLIHPIMGDSPKDILQTRLAKGEITIEEFEKLSKKLR